jgi:hypothetical protein
VDLDIRYSQSAGVAIACQVVGDGETDLVVVPGDQGGPPVVRQRDPHRRQPGDGLTS